jgi:hypothetical protein
MKEQPPGHTPEQLADLVEKQRKQQEDIDWLNAQFSRPGAWTIGKELGGDWIAAGIVDAMAKQGPRKDVQ